MCVYATVQGYDPSSVFVNNLFPHPVRFLHMLVHFTPSPQRISPWAYSLFNSSWGSARAANKALLLRGSLANRRKGYLLRLHGDRSSEEIAFVWHLESTELFIRCSRSQNTRDTFFIQLYAARCIPSGYQSPLDTVAFSLQHSVVNRRVKRKTARKRAENLLLPSSIC